MGKAENLVQNQILEGLKALKIYAWRNNNGGVYDPSKGSFRKPHNTVAATDIEGIYDGMFLGIECKRQMRLDAPSETNFCSTPQADHIESINREGGMAFQARGWDDVELHIVIHDFKKIKDWDDEYETPLSQYWVKYKHLYDNLDIEGLNVADIRSTIKALVTSVMDCEDHEIDKMYQQLKAHKRALAGVYRRFLEHKYTLTKFFKNYRLDY